MAIHHDLDNVPSPEKALYVNEVELSDITAVNDYPPFCDEEQPDNIRIYIPMDLNHRAMIRRLNDIYRCYGYPTYKNESNFWQETEHVISQLEIYDQVWSVRDGRLGNGHSKKATEVAKEMLAILESDEGTAECFPFTVIEDLKREYELD